MNPRLLVGFFLLLLFQGCALDRSAGEASFHKRRGMLGSDREARAVIVDGEHRIQRTYSSVPLVLSSDNQENKEIAEPVACTDHGPAGLAASRSQPLPRSYRRPQGTPPANVHIVRQATADPQRLPTELPPRTKWNRMAIGSALLLVAGLIWAISIQSTELLILVGAVSLTLAIISAIRCRDKGERGEGFALMTMALAGAVLITGLLAFLSRFL